MKKLLIGLFVIVFLMVIAGAGALYYIRPDQSLDLAYRNVPLEDRALDMARRMSLELILTADDLNNLAKKSIADNPQVEQDVVVTGANFSLNGNRMTADLNIIWKDQVPAALRIVYLMSWHDPNVVATVETAKLKGIDLPASMFSDRIIPIGDDLPRLLKIKDLEWGEGEVKVLFRKPSLRDLQQLIG